MKTKVVHCKKEKYDVYIGRSNDPISGKWGNPFTHIANSRTLAEFVVSNREEAIKKYEEWITLGNGQHLLKDLHELDGKILGCWCAPKSCHGDILIKLINER